MNRILIAEYFCSGAGGAGSAGTILSEARLLLEASAADFSALPGVRCLTLVRPGLRIDMPPGHEARIVPSAGGFSRAFREALAGATGALVIAPEVDGILLRLTRAIERSGATNLGCGSGAVRIASDKWLTYRALRRAGVPQPPTIRIAARGRLRLEALPPWAHRRGRGWIVKPRDGYGCLGMGAVTAVSGAEGQRQLDGARRRARRHTRRAHLVLQERVPGMAASVSLIGDGRRARPVSLNLQRLRWGEEVEYLGGRAGVDHPLREQAFETAARAARAIPGLRGYFGVDLVLGDDVRVIEVNPRLTTSYVGLRRVAASNPAGWILAAAGRRARSRQQGGPRRRERRQPGEWPRRQGWLRARSKGSAEFSVQCPTSSAGTSAASI